MPNKKYRDPRGGKQEESQSFDINSENIALGRTVDLLRLFPEAETERGQIDFDRLRLGLGEAVDIGRERYGMTWPGKAECFRAIQSPSIATLTPCPDESIRFESSGNVVIEGDNLEALKLLQKSYTGKIKAIYIDPPYNTGHDFVYPDNFDEPLHAYLELTGQVDGEGKRLGTNTDADGRFHSKWLNMMYPRLYLARNLLREDGVIFISIDDNEVNNLRKLCDEVFGEENFLVQFVWTTKTAPKGVPTRNMLVSNHEYVVAYQKASGFAFDGNPRDKQQFSNPDNDPRGPWKADNMKSTLQTAKEFTVVDPETGNEYTKKWAFAKDTIERMIADGRILFPRDASGTPRQKRFASQYTNENTPIVSQLGTFHTETATNKLKELLGTDKIFDFPKPVELIGSLLSQATGSDDIVLDFFAGSGTTAQAVLELNAKDGGHRKFILVQLPEPTGRADYPTIADVTKERVRRVIQKLGNDGGFRVFKLAESNFTVWDAGAVQDADSLSRQLQLHVDHIRPGRTDEDLLFEILLKSGYPLTVPVERLTLGGATVQSIDGEKMLVCLDRALTLSAIRAMAEQEPERIVCLDAGFAGNDQLKTNAVQIFKTKGVPSFKTV
jgi:adenine-specific DNA-methyltransferase